MSAIRQVDTARVFIPRLTGVTLVLISLFVLGHCDRPASAQSQAKSSAGAAADVSKQTGSPSGDESAEDRQERIAAERFLELLKKRPRVGTALDKVYGYHVQRGTLDEFSRSLRSEAESKNSGEAWMLLGLVSMQRGQDAEARQALEKAEQLLPKEPLASFYLGKTLVLLGEVDAAAKALERAIERKPARADMLQVFQELGRLYQRTRRVEDAVAVWNRMEKLFPGDTQVQEQIAVVLAEEGANAEALARFEALAKSTKDRFRRVEMAVRAAQLKEAVGRRDEALADFETILGQVNPDSWIYQDVRNRVDAVFLNRNDYDALAKYYTAWIEKHPDDIDAMLRVGRLLSVQRRSSEAKAWFTKAIEKAPSEAAPRLALVDALERDQDLAGAAAAMEALVEKHSDNPDYIVRWGELVFANRAVPEAERGAQAAKIWKKLLDKRGNDAVTVARVADLLRGVLLTEDALAAYRKAIELAQDEPQYREYLGEYLFQLGRKEEALAVWRELATGSRETRDNLVRLSEVYSTFKLNDEALATMARACELQPTFGQRARYAEMLRESQQYDASLSQLELAGKLAESPEEHALVVEEQIKVYQANEQLDERTAELETAVAGADKDNASAWEKLALYQEADRKYHQAAESIARAAELQPQSIAIHTAAFRVQERAGLFGDAIASLRKLAALDRRFLSNYLTQIATLQMRLGQIDDALATGEQLISASGAGSDQFRFFAELCFQAGKTEQGLNALRRNVRANPGDREAMRLLARHLADQFRSEEAIELYWRSFDLAPALDEKRSDVEALSELYLRTNRFDQLVSRLETSGREDNRQREATLLIAAANQAIGDLGAARALLEPLLREDSRDADLLGTVLKIAQVEYDWDAAVRYQKRLNEVAPNPAGEYQLAKFLLEQGEVAQAESIWAQLSIKFASAENLKQMIDRLLAKGEQERVVAVIEQAVKREPDNWELLPVAISGLWRSDKHPRAIELCDHLLSLQVPSDTKSSTAKQLLAKKGAQPNTFASASISPGISGTDSFSRTAWLSRLGQNTYWMRNMYDPFGVQYTRSGMSLPLTIYTFADAKAFAAAVKQVAQNQPEAREQASGRLKEQLASDDIERLWLELGLQQAGLNVPLGVASSGTSTPRPKPGEGFTESPRSQLLERLYELGDKDAVTLLFGHRLNERMNSTSGAGEAPHRAPLSQAELEQIQKLYADLPTKTAGYALWLAEEFKRAENKAETQRYLDEAIALMEAKPSTSEATGFLRWDSERAVRYFVQTLNSAAQNQQRSRTSGASLPYQTASFIATLLNESQDSKAINFLIARLKQDQAAYAKSLRPSQLAQYDPTRSFNTRMSVPGSQTPITIQVDFPTQSALQSFDLLIALRLAHSDATKDIKEAVGKQLESDAKDPDEDVMLSAIDHLCYASWLWWSDSKPAALEQIEAVRQLGVAKELVAILESRMLYEVGRIDEALATLEAFRPLNQQMLQDRELAILQLVLQKGDLARAKQSAERLFALRLPTPIQMQVAELMTQLGMRELADSVMQRIRQRGGGDLSSQVQLMQKLQAVKNDDAACEIARQILRRTQPSSNRNYRTMDDVYRQNAVRVLTSTGQAKALIESLQERRQKSPNSVAIVLELAELYEASGKQKEAQEILGTLNKSDSQDPRALVATAQALAKSNKHAEAVDKYLAAIEKQPDLLDREYYGLRTSMQQGNLWEKAVERIETIGVAKFSRSYRTGELVSDLMQHNKPEAAKRLMKAVLRQVGVQGMNNLSMTMLLRNPNGPNSKVIDNEIRQVAFEQLSSFIDSQADPMLLFQRHSQGSNGQVLSTLVLLNMLLQDDSARVAQLIKKIEPLKGENDCWIVLIAGLQVIDKQYQQASDLVKPLLENVGNRRAQLENLVWEVGSLLAHEHGQYERAIEMMQPWVAIEDRNIGSGSRQEMTFSMKGLLFFCYMKTKQFDKAKELLDEDVATYVGDPSMSQSNPGYNESQIYQSRMRAATHYVEIDAPLEALQLVGALKNDNKLLAAAARWNGNLEYLTQTLDNTARSARSKLSKVSLDGLVRGLMKSPSRDSLESLRKYPAFVLTLEHELSKDRKPQVTCLLMQTLKLQRKNADLAQWGETILAEATSKTDSERSILGNVALICVADAFDKPEAIATLAESLLEQLNAETEQPESPKVAEPSADSKQPLKTNSLAEVQAVLLKQERMAIWLAVDCLRRHDQKELAVRLAQVAGSVERDADDKSIDAITQRLQMASLRLELGETETAEKELRAIIDDLLPPKQ